ncbi:hypothetical protein ACLUWG_04450 [Bifidobacterium apri]|uniref:hypothetical protein n=1 Tax=Bifidobacterium apri TaxID=1769423 RepID=UPI003992F174
MSRRFGSVVKRKNRNGVPTYLLARYPNPKEPGRGGQEVPSWRGGVGVCLAGWLSRLIEARDRSIYNSSSSRDIEVYYLYGQTGVGKTSYVMNKYAPEDVYRVSDYQHPFDGYENQKVLLMDEFAGTLPFDQLLNVTDRWRTTLASRYHTGSPCTTPCGS